MSNPYGNPKYEPWMNEKALRFFKEGDSVTAICCELGISRETYYRWKDDPSHPFYPVAQEGEKLSQTWWERQGKQAIFSTDKEMKFAGSAYMFVLKNRFRDSYSDQQPVATALSAIEQLLKSKE